MTIYPLEIFESDDGVIVLTQDDDEICLTKEVLQIVCDELLRLKD